MEIRYTINQHEKHVNLNFSYNYEGKVPETIWTMTDKIYKYISGINHKHFSEILSTNRTPCL
jgi:hypothetical protein